MTADWSDIERGRYLFYRDILKEYDNADTENKMASNKLNMPQADIDAIVKWPQKMKDLLSIRYNDIHGSSDRNDERDVVDSANEKEILDKQPPEIKEFYKYLLPSDYNDALWARYEIWQKRESRKKHVARKEEQVNSIPLLGTTSDVKIPAQMNELFKSAITAYDNANNKEKKEILKKLLNEKESGPFSPDIYCQLGDLESGHCDHLESYNADKALEYYEIAHRLYGRKYSSNHATIWASIVNFKRTYEESKAYLEWLYYIRDKATADDIFPYRTYQDVTEGASATLTEKEKERILLQARKNQLPTLISCTEACIAHNFFGQTDILDKLENDFKTEHLAAEIQKRKKEYSNMNAGNSGKTTNDN